MNAIKTIALALSIIGSASAIAAPAANVNLNTNVKPTVILVHGAFADATSWNGVAAKLRADGYTVIGAANPLRSVKSDAASVATIVKSVKGPVVLVGHSYGGAVISAAAYGQSNV
jgi:pimeloyl-ACP methyl ester carboxylesterase